MAGLDGVLRIGGNGVWGEWFAGLIDEVRVYDRALSAAEVQQDMQTAVAARRRRPTRSAPSAPVRAAASTAIGSAVTLGWTASSDNVGVVALQRPPLADRGLHACRRRTGSPSRPARATPTPGSPPAPTTTGSRREDAAGNISAASAQVTAVVPADQPPTRLGHRACGGCDGQRHGHGQARRLGRRRRCRRPVPARAVNLGSEDTSAPYSISWDTTTVGNGSYSITAVARDSAGQTTTSTADHRHRQQPPGRRWAWPGGGVRIRRGVGHDRGGLVREGQVGVGLGARRWNAAAGMARR